MGRKQLFLQYVCLGLLLAASFRPYWGTTEKHVPTPVKTVLIALDVSKSMAVQDVKPSRLERAKRLLQSAFRKKTSSSIRVGIVLFAGSATLYTPPTEDRRILESYLETISPELILDEGSNIPEALEISRAAIQDQQGAILLISDGEVDSADQTIALKRARQSSIPIFTVTVGTANGAVIPDQQEGFIHDAKGQVVISKADSSFMGEIASGSGGHALEAEGSEDLLSLLDGQFYTNTATTVTRTEKNEIGFVLLALVAVIVLTTPLINRRMSPLLGVLLLIHVLQSNAYGDSNPLTEEVKQYQAFQAYRDKNFDKASQEYQTLPDGWKSAQGQGNAAFRKRDFDASLRHYDHGAETASSDHEKI